MSYQDLSIFFFDELYSINEHRGGRITTNSVGYLSELLLKGMKNDFLFQDGNKKYLFDMYIKTIEAKSERERFRHYKELGDYSLFMCGYFTEGINPVVGIEYYIDMGSQAYYEAASYNKYSEPFYELSEKYIYCLSIINELSIKDKHDNPRDILKLYDFWMTTKSQFTKEKLLKLGLITEIIEE